MLVAFLGEVVAQLKNVIQQEQYQQKKERNMLEDLEEMKMKAPFKTTSLTTKPQEQK